MNDEEKLAVLPKAEVLEKKKEIKVIESDLIESLKEDPSFLAQKYNDRKLKETEKKLRETEKKIKEREKNKKNETTPIAVEIIKPQKIELPSRTGGIYVPPHKLAQLQKEIIQSEEKLGLEHQKLMWELLRKSINGIINKV